MNEKDCGHLPHFYDEDYGCYDCFAEQVEREEDLIEGEYDHGTYDYIYDDAEEG